MKKRKRTSAAISPEEVAQARMNAPVVHDWILQHNRLPIGDEHADEVERLVFGFLNGAPDEEGRFVRGIASVAVSEYLRQFPRARSRHGTFVMTWQPHEVGGLRRGGEWDYSCLFCRKSLNGLPPGGGTLPRAFVEDLQRHTHECAAAYLAGMMQPSPPPRGKRKPI